MMNHPKIAIKVKNYGTMTAELYPEYAPKTVENFLSLIEKDFFRGLIFHRVIKGFMIQGGGYTADFSSRETGADRAVGEEFVVWCAGFAEANNMNITITISDDPNLASDALKKYL